MPKFKVHAIRTSYAVAEIEVEADNIIQARVEAYGVLGDHLYNEKTAEYDVDYVELIKED